MSQSKNDTKYQIQTRSYTFESRDYTGDRIEGKGVGFVVVSKGRVLESFSSRRDAQTFVNSKTAFGKRLLARISKNDSSVAKLEKQIERLSKDSLKAIKTLERRKLRSS